MQSTPLTFPGSSGNTLSARLELPPDGEARGCAIFAHCFTCSKDLNTVVRIARALTEEGLAVLRFDFTGLGESEGEFAATNFSSNVDDLVAAARFMEGRGMPPLLLIGHSLGGTAALVAADRIPSLRGLVTIGAPADAWHVTGMLGASPEQIEAAGEAEVDIGGRPFRVRRQLLDDLRGARVDDALRRLPAPLLILHAPADARVGIDHATRIYRGTRGNRSFVSLDDADHLLSNPADARYAGRVIATWASRYLPAPAEPSVSELERGEVVAVTGAGFRTEIAAGNHVWVADEPTSVGGTDAGPTPYDFLMAALGACTGITLRMYADRKNWPLEEVAVRLTHGKVHAVHGGACDRADSCVFQVNRTLTLAGPLSEEQRARLAEIADRCPVHRTVEAGIRVKTTVVEKEKGRSG